MIICYWSLQHFSLPDSKERVSVTHIESPERFYVQLLKLKPKLNKLTQNLNAYVKRNPPVVDNPEKSKFLNQPRSTYTVLSI